MIQASIKPIFVHCHIYYPELWPELKTCIQNIHPYPFELFVTMVENHQRIINDILSSFPNAHIEIVENRGYDIGPFVYTLNKIVLDNYSYIIKLHTKRNIDVNMPFPFRNMIGSIWRDNLLQFIKNKENLKNCIETFQKNPNIGMQAYYELIVQYDIYDKAATQGLSQYLKERKMPEIEYAFVAGCMFIARAKPFEEIQKLKLNLFDFPPPKTIKNSHYSQLAHIIERFIGYIIYLNKMVILDSSVSEKEQKEFQENILNWINLIGAEGTALLR